jgi:hypothetical protein
METEQILIIGLLVLLVVNICLSGVVLSKVNSSKDNFETEDEWK